MVSKYFLQFFEWLKNFYFYFGNFICVHPVFWSYSPRLLPSSSSHGSPSFQQAPLQFPNLSVAVIAYTRGHLPKHDLHWGSPADESRVPLKLSFEAPERCPFWGTTALNLDRESFPSAFLYLLLLVCLLFRDKKWLQIQRPISPFSANSFIALVLKFWSLKGI